MINVWNYKDAKKIKLIDIDNQIFTGNVYDINDAEDESEDYGFNEDSICLNINGNLVDIRQSEIKSIEILD